MAPDAQINCPFEGSKCGRSRAVCTPSSPDTPSIITRRTSPMRLADERDALAPARRQRAAKRLGAHPLGAVRVLPAPRPPRISHTRHGSMASLAAGGN